VNDINDIKALAELEPVGVVGIITGRALYEGSLVLKDALEVTRAKN
jgi:phosphoribosylformimino-5-aminoimidazole carboxamide ribonucleotide (ProFAR) isomerase